METLRPRTSASGKARWRPVFRGTDTLVCASVECIDHPESNRHTCRVELPLTPVNKRRGKFYPSQIRRRQIFGSTIPCWDWYLPFLSL